MSERKGNKQKRTTEKKRSIDKVSINRFGFQLEMSNASWTDVIKIAALYSIFLIINGLSFFLCLEKLPKIFIEKISPYIRVQ